jgi:hypothetical protein
MVIGKTHYTKYYKRVRLKAPSRFQKGSFRTITLSKKRGIKGIVGRLKGSTRTTLQAKLIKRR